MRRGCELAITIDERICDGQYLTEALARFTELVENPVQLEEGLAEVIPDVP